MTETIDQPLAWHSGNILPLKDLSVSAGDSALEHGLGLFESMRSEKGQVPLLSRHLDRMTRSALELGLKLNSSQLPDIVAITELVDRCRLASGSGRLRMVLTGGCRGESGKIWVTANSLDRIDCDNLKLSSDFWPVDERDDLVRFKTLNYWLRRRAFERATAGGCHEIISVDSNGYLWEGSRTAIFLVKNDQILSPPTDGPMLASIAAEVVRELALEMDMPTVCKHLRIDDLMAADEVILTNALRGILSVGKFGEFSYSTPGNVTDALRKCWKNKYF